MIGPSGIVPAIERKSRCDLYAGFLGRNCAIMLIIKAIPKTIFTRMKL
jgi:hypothetical protein